MKKAVSALALAAVVAPCGPPPRPSRCPCPGMTCACPITVKHGDFQGRWRE